MRGRRIEHFRDDDHELLGWIEPVGTGFDVPFRAAHAAVHGGLGEAWRSLPWKQVSKPLPALLFPQVGAVR